MWRQRRGQHTLYSYVLPVELRDRNAKNNLIELVGLSCSDVVVFVFFFQCLCFTKAVTKIKYLHFKNLTDHNRHRGGILQFFLLNLSDSLSQCFKWERVDICCDSIAAAGEMTDQITSQCHGDNSLTFVDNHKKKTASVNIKHATL